ncbi:MAG: hypothetical protein JO345_35415 [Streptosporangiaceae bacterium]|nr:hypothetical protein [Streptosporangiaceae bacterium]
MTRLFAGAVTGVVGPAVFTGAWVIGSLRQTGSAPAGNPAPAQVRSGPPG